MDKPTIDELASLIGETPDLVLEESVILEAGSLRYDMPIEEWEGKNHNKQSIITKLVKPTDRSLSIDANRYIYLPMFVSEYNLNWVFGAMAEMTKNDEGLEVTGSPAWVFEGKVLPEFPEQSLNAEMSAAMNSDISDSMAIATVNGRPLSELENDQFSSNIDTTGDWLEELRKLLRRHIDDGNVEVKRANLPETLRNYKVLSAYLRPGSVMLFSPNRGEGLYVVAKNLNMKHDELGVRPGMPFDAAIRLFYTDPEGFLRTVENRTRESEQELHGRSRLYLRDYLRATKQGDYIQRSAKQAIPIINAYIEGDPIPDMEPGLLEHLDHTAFLYD